MKRFLLSAIAVMAFGFVNAQNGHFKIGAHTGLPIGDASDLFTINLGVDAAYLWNLGDKFSAGATTGYTIYSGKRETYNYGGMSYENKIKDASFIPVAGTAQYSINNNLFVGLDLGYAFFLGQNSVGATDTGGGVLFQPKFGYQNNKIELFATYKSISDDRSLSSLNIGFNYKF
ncbi:hypothetical protein GKZ90_0024355 [Flavobacterium sp. MC2016-06]|jgi:hypothetical protein|uniref:hypothetical protein n=1 Tax=Flavobacterium sp. MC2016-06 TaxID=2676308 RepID=UPI0012BAE9DF|nr:hypothetical protein [Flavobacterium sp. MC2016-06]MBU3861887.1 hypothetical protein [Flavobacterium sp. MC2016-06]